MGRSPCCTKEGLKRGAWSSQEDQILTNYIRTHGQGKWRLLPQKAGLNRCGKSCRLRWLNYLRPDIKRGAISKDEEDLIIRLHSLLGNRWSLIAGRIPGRTDNEIKNYWNTKLAKQHNYDKKAASKLARARSKKSETKTLKRNRESSKNQTEPIQCKVSRCRTAILSMIHEDQGSGLDHVTTSSHISAISNGWINENDQIMSSSSAFDLELELVPWLMARDQDHGPCSSNNTNAKVATSSLGLAHEHDPFGIHTDLSVKNINTVFNQNQRIPLNPNPNSDYKSPMDEADRALNVNHDVDNEPTLSPSPDSLVEENGADEIKIGGKMEFDLTLELRKVASFLDLEED